MNLDDKLRENLRAFNEASQAIRDMQVDAGVGVPVDVTPEAKAQMQRDLFAKHDRRYRELAAEKIQTVETNLERTRMKAFKPHVGMDSHAVVMQSFRDALDRVEGITDSRELRRKLAQAHELGDGIQAKAILYKGYSLGADFGGTEIVTDYLQRYPSEQGQWEEFQQAAEAHNNLERMGPGFQPMPLPGVGSVTQIREAG